MILGKRSTRVDEARERVQERKRSVVLQIKHTLGHTRNDIRKRIVTGRIRIETTNKSKESKKGELGEES